MFEENSTRFYKKAENITLPKQQLEREYSSKLLVKRYQKLIDNLKEKNNQNERNLEKIALIEKYTVTSKVREIFRELSRKPNFIFNKLFSTKTRPKVEIVTAFTGVLELSRKSKVTTHQESLFGDIVVEKNRKPSI